MAQEEEVLGKAYDSRLMKRLLTYLRPYSWQTAVALTAILLKVVLGPDVIGPFLTATVIDKYLSFAAGKHHWFLDGWLNPNPWIGIGQIAGIYLASLLFNFVLEFVQTYLMQWTGQMVMFDLRSHIFRHLQQMHVAFFDKNPVGRLVTRVTTDVDALNEMFTAGVVSIFEDVFVLDAEDEVVAGIDHLCRAASDLLGDHDFPPVGPRLLQADPRGHCPHQRVSAGARYGHGGAPALQPRAARL
jgi:ATP-binding cassette subfamily B multidrug efflux pump